MPRYTTQSAEGFVVNPPSIDKNSDERCVETSAKVMVNGDTIFTIKNGPILIQELLSVCQTANDATASTLQYKSNPNGGATIKWPAEAFARNKMIFEEKWIN